MLRRDETSGRRIDVRQAALRGAGDRVTALRAVVAAGMLGFVLVAGAGGGASAQDGDVEFACSVMPADAATQGAVVPEASRCVWTVPRPELNENGYAQVTPYGTVDDARAAYDASLERAQNSYDISEVILVDIGDAGHVYNYDASEPRGGWVEFIRDRFVVTVNWRDDRDLNLAYAAEIDANLMATLGLAAPDSSQPADSDPNEQTAAPSDRSSGSPIPLPAAIGGGALLVGGAVAGIRVARRTATPHRVDAPERSEDSSDERRWTVVLELTHPAGRSPKVFTDGWVFGVRCIVEPGTAHQQDYSSAVRWDGSGTFTPTVGPQSRPQFVAPGPNTIRLSVDVDGVTHTKTVTVEAVSPAGYARLGDIALCRSCAHGCPACPHLDSWGSILVGSPTVNINGLPAARVGDHGFHAACCANNLFEITGGDPTVLIDGRPAAHFGSPTLHCTGFSGSLVTAYQHGHPNDWLT